MALFQKVFQHPAVPAKMEYDFGREAAA